MAKQKVRYECSECGYTSPKWMGRCTSCGKWNTLSEKIDADINLKTGQRASIGSNAKPVRITEISGKKFDRIKTNIPEFDRALGGGIVTDSVVILTASPGTGKSTLLLQTCQNVVKQGFKVLYCSGEESEAQIKDRGERIFGKDLSEDIYIQSTNSMDVIVENANEIKPNLLIVDSIQTVELASSLPSRAGGPKQVTDCANMLISIAKNKNIAVVIVGQVTKDGDLAGINYLEHAVDAVLKLEGDKNTPLRVCSPSKNRFGSTEEVGLFSMTERGLISVENPDALFTTERDKPVVGAALASVAEGTRTFVVEVQSLVTSSSYGNPIRNAIGVNKDYLRVLTAMLQARTRVSVANDDVNLQVSGGLYIKDVGANLGIVMAIVSSKANYAIPQGTVFIGEVGLTGEITNVPYLSSRIKTIDRYGYKTVYIPKGALEEPIKTKNVKVVEISTLEEVIQKVLS